MEVPSQAPINHVTKFSPLLIGVSGGSASGKTRVCEAIKKDLP